MDKHYTSTTYLLNEKRDKTLLLFHSKFSKWLPPGGHIEINETPEEAARREISEEIGVNNLIFIEKKRDDFTVNDERTETLLLPHFLLSEQIGTAHYHLDWIFYAEIKEEDYKSPENLEMKWFTEKELENEVKVFQNVKDLGLYGLSNNF